MFLSLVLLLLFVAVEAEGCSSGGRTEKAGTCCVFPFTYKGKKYTSCTKAGHDRDWCATTDNYPKDGKWENCKEPKAYGGWCLNVHGKDENAGIIRVAASTKDGCLTACLKNQNAKGCEWGDNICIVHTNQVCSGSGKGSHSCWVLKSKDCPVDGGWSSWTSFGKCSKTCDVGAQIRTRTCTNPSPVGSGSTCSGSTTESRRCHEWKKFKVCTGAEFKGCFTDYNLKATYVGQGMPYWSQIKRKTGVRSVLWCCRYCARIRKAGGTQWDSFMWSKRNWCACFKNERSFPKKRRSDMMFYKYN